MGLQELESLAQRFAQAASKSASVRAVFVGGSLASRTADDHSDLDLYVIARDGKLGVVSALVPELLAQAGRVLFLRHIDHGFPMFLFTCSDGTRGEVGVSEASGLSDLHYGAYRILFDHDGLLDGYVFPGWPLTAEEQQALLLEALDWFWRAALNAGHYLARGDAWSAVEELRAARGQAATLLRLRRSGAARPPGGLHKLAAELPEEDREVLAASFTPLELGAMTTSLARLCSMAHAFGQRELAGKTERNRLVSLADLVRALVPFS